jgi:hypothetical protein
MPSTPDEGWSQREAYVKIFAEITERVNLTGFNALETGGIIVFIVYGT